MRLLSFHTDAIEQALTRLLLVLLAFSTIGTITNDASADPSEGIIVRRTTLLVHDAAVSVAFYRDILGFEVWYESDGIISGTGLPVVDAEIGEPTKFVIMKGKDSYMGMIGLLQYGNPKTHDRLTESPEMRAGDFILMIEMSGIDDVVEALTARKHPIYKLPKTSRIKSVTDEWDAKVMYLLDPDGHMIELTERLN